MTTPNQTLITNLEVALAVAKQPEQGWQYRLADDADWVTGYGNPTCLLLNSSIKLRLAPITFPDPPPGDSWHNPDNLDAETVGVQDGWRLLLRSEVEERQKDFDKCVGAEMWYPASGSWSSGFGNKLHYTYRTLAKLPSRPVLRDWDRPEDVPGPVCWLRAPGWAFASMVVCVFNNGVCVHFNGQHRQVDWCEFKSGIEYSTTRRADDWHPCKVQEGGK